MRNIFGKSKERKEKLKKFFLRKKTPRKEKFEKFKPISRLALLKKRLELLEDAKKRTEEDISLDTHLAILGSLKTVFKGDKDFQQIFGDDSESEPPKISEEEKKTKEDKKTEEDKRTEKEKIYDVVKKHLEDFKETPDIYKNLSPFVFIKRYSEGEQYDILPDAMQSDYDDIPDENGMSKFEVVETIRQFGEILNNITNKERNLYSKLDCSLYAEQYLDTLEQIATLYHRRIIPKKAADYFENKFAYGINLLNWYSKFVDADPKKPGNNNPPKFDPEKEQSKEEREQEKEERWTDFKWFCRGGDLQKNKITEFKEDDKDVDKGEDLQKNKITESKEPDKAVDKGVLPTVMYYYEDLPDEEGIKPSEVLEIMRNYSKQLTDLSGREPELKTQIDCSVYAKQYLDTLEQIAYLFNKNSLVTDSDNYFENNFNYGLTLKNWYLENVFGAGEQKHRWDEFDSYVESYNKKNKNNLTQFNLKSVLPLSMLNYEKLDNDQICKEYKDLNKNKKE